jgi:hypothetical protein
MQDSGDVRLRQSVRDLDSVAEDLLQTQALGRNHLIEPFSFDEFHGDEIHVAVTADFVDRNDIRVVQGGRRAGLAE